MNELNNELIDKIADEILAVMRKYDLTVSQAAYMVEPVKGPISKKIREIELNSKL